MQDLVMFWAASIAMVALVAAMAWCCLATLGWLPQWATPACTRARPAPGGPPTRRELALWFAVALCYQWLVLFVAHCLARQGAAGFGEALVARFTTAGDSPHYLWLAENGYAADPEKANLVAFYPLYPLAMRLLAPLFGGDTALCGVWVSRVCFAGAVAAFRSLAAQTLPTGGGRAATAALLLYPFSFFSFGVYTEGLFLLLATGCLGQLGRRRWGAAGLLAFLAALCRTQGLALFFACAFAWLAAPRQSRRRPSAWLLLGAPAGYGCYLALNWALFGDFFRYLYYQSIAPWYQSARWFGSNLVQQLGMARAYPGLARFIYLPQIALYFLGAAALAWLLFRGGCRAVAVYSVAYFGMSYLSSWLISGGRYMFGCLGLYFAVGLLPRRGARCAALAAEGALLLLYAVYYMQGQAIM